MAKVGKIIAIAAGGLIIAGAIHSQFLSINQAFPALLSVFVIGGLAGWLASSK